MLFIFCSCENEPNENQCASFAFHLVFCFRVLLYSRSSFYVAPFRRNIYFFLLCIFYAKKNQIIMLKSKRNEREIEKNIDRRNKSRAHQRFEKKKTDRTTKICIAWCLYTPNHWNTPFNPFFLRQLFFCRCFTLSRSCRCNTLTSILSADFGKFSPKTNMWKEKSFQLFD